VSRRRDGYACVVGGAAIWVGGSVARRGELVWQALLYTVCQTEAGLAVGAVVGAVIVVGVGFDWFEGLAL
jgi:Na+/H+-dicarboxylate symporter